MSELVEKVAVVIFNTSIISALSTGAYLGIRRLGENMRRDNERNQPRQEPRLDSKSARTKAPIYGKR